MFQPFLLRIKYQKKMTLGDVVLKLQKTLVMTDTESHQTLSADVKKWEVEATPQAENKLQALYGRLHKGVLLRMLNPFLYYIVLNKMRTAMNPQMNDDFLD